MKLRLNLSFSSAMRKWLCWASCAALCFTSPVVAEAQITQQQVEDAFYNALMAFTEDSSGTPGMFVNFPLDLNTFADLGSYLSSTAYHTTVGDSAYLTLASLVGVDTRFWDFLRTLSPSNQLDRLFSVLGFDEMDTAAWYLSEIENDLDWVSVYSGDINAKLQFLNFISGSHGSALLVTDPDVLAALQALDDKADGIGNTLGDIRDNTDELDTIRGDLASVAGDVSGWREEWNDANADYQELDSTASTNASVAMRDARSDYERAETNALREVEELEAPSRGPDYDPNPDSSDIAGADLGLGLVNASVDHNALVTLIPSRGSASGLLPSVEVDFGRMSELVTGVSRFGSWASWLYGVLFGVLFSVKGVHMWRVCHVATMQSSCGLDPNITLAWNPF